MRGEGKILLALLGIAAVLPLLVHDEYFIHLLVVAGFYVILASSLNLIVGYVGELSLGHAAYLGLGAYAAALLSARYTAAGPGLSLLAGALAGGIGGIVIGALTLRLKGPYFVIVTLSFAEVLRLVANNWVVVTNGPMGISGIRQPDLALGSWTFTVRSQTEFFYLVLALAAIALLIMYRFIHSNMGRAAVAIRENRNVAQSIGVDPFFYALAAFVLGALFAGMAGAFYAQYFTFVGPEVFGFSFMVSMLIMVLVGGKGTLIGPVIGAIFVTLLDEYLREAQQLRLSIFGLLVVAVVLFLPSGLVGLPAKLRELRLLPQGRR